MNLDETVKQQLPDEGEKFRREQEKTRIANCDAICQKVKEMSLPKSDAFIVAVKESYSRKLSGPEVQLSLANGGMGDSEW